MFKRIGIDEQTVSTWIAGAVARAITNPVDIVKIRQQVGGRHDQKGTLMTLMSLMNDDGTMAWFKGYLVNVVKCVKPLFFISSRSAHSFILYDFVVFLVNFRQIPYDIAYAVTTDYAKDWLIPFGLSSETVEVMLAIEGSMIANALTYPLETIRTRLVVQETKDNEKYEGIVDTLNTIITEEGYLALFKGVEATMLGVIPFELGMHFVRKAVGWYFPEDTWKLLKVSLATIIAKTLAYPFELVSRKMQAQSPFVAAENVGIKHNNVQIFS